MERRIILMRHAKSSWSSRDLSDRERPLNKRGRRDAPRVARELARRGWTPELVLCSDAARTRETFERMCQRLAFEPQVKYVPSFYEGGIEEIRGELVKAPKGVGSVLVLGHNPGWEMALEWFTGERETVTTANAALLKGRGATWREAVSLEHSWRLLELIRPKELR